MVFGHVHLSKYKEFTTPVHEQQTLNFQTLTQMTKMLNYPSLEKLLFQAVRKVFVGFVGRKTIIPLNFSIPPTPGTQSFLVILFHTLFFTKLS